MSTSVFFPKLGSFGRRLGKGIFAEAQTLPPALGIRVNTRLTVTVVKHYLFIPYPLPILAIL